MKSKRLSSPKDLSDTDDFTDNVRRGLELFQSGRLSEAENEYREAIRQNPEDLDAWTFLGYTLSSKGEF